MEADMNEACTVSSQAQNFTHPRLSESDGAEMLDFDNLSISAFSDSENDSQFNPQAFPHVTKSQYLPIVPSNEEIHFNVLTCVIDQVFNLCCNHCECCKKITSFLKPGVSSAFLSSSKNSDVESRKLKKIDQKVNSSEKVNIISCQVLKPPHSLTEVVETDCNVTNQKPNIVKENKGNNITPDILPKTVKNLNKSITYKVKGIKRQKRRNRTNWNKKKLTRTNQKEDVIQNGNTPDKKSTNFISYKGPKDIETSLPESNILSLIKESRLIESPVGLRASVNCNSSDFEEENIQMKVDTPKKGLKTTAKRKSEQGGRRPRRSPKKQIETENDSPKGSHSTRPIGFRESLNSDTWDLYKENAKPKVTRKKRSASPVMKIPEKVTKLHDSKNRRSSFKKSDYAKCLLEVPIETTNNVNVSKALQRKLARCGGVIKSKNIRSLAKTGREKPTTKRTDVRLSEGFLQERDEWDRTSMPKLKKLYTSDEWLNSEDFNNLTQE